MRLSIVIPVLNSEQTLPECLAAIRGQTLPRTDYEIVLADAGSTDRTLEIAHEAGVDVIVPNPLRTGEAGKTAGIKAAHGEIIALVDSDNILPDAGWLERMLAPFADPEIVATEPIAYTSRPQDPALTRYFALLGMNDPICLFTRNYDRICAITGRWTGLPIVGTDPGAALGTGPSGALGTDPAALGTGPRWRWGQALFEPLKSQQDEKGEELER